MTRPQVICFDVNETLSDLSPLGARFVELGASGSLAPLWFTSVLRDGFALSEMGRSAPFADVSADVLRGLLTHVSLDRSLESAVGHVMAGFGSLELHPDVADAVVRLHDAGFRLVTLSNGAASVAKSLLDAADVSQHFEHLLSVDDAGAWKPDANAYGFAVRRCGVEPGQVALVAVHPWDVAGAVAAGLQGIWLNRSGLPYPDVFGEPTHTVADLAELAELDW